MRTGNLYRDIPATRSEELVQTLVAAPAARIERIVSRGHATPPGRWYDQDTHELVVLIAGRAELVIEGRSEPLDLTPGDYVDIPAHVRHRVERTDPGADTIWLAIHY